MKSFFHLAALLAAFAMSTSNVSADEAVGEKTCSEKTCSEGVCPASCDSAECASALEALPKMTYLVGTESTCCDKSAASLAQKHDAPIQFVVGEETFDSKEDAYETLISKTEEMVNAFTTPSTCHVSGTTTIAGEKCSCSVKAGEIAKQVSAATQLVSMSYKVGEESCNCPMSAAAMAKKAGTDMTYVIAGEETTCSKTARLKLAQAKYLAAVKAAAKMNAPEEAPEAASTESET